VKRKNSDRLRETLISRGGRQEAMKIAKGVAITVGIAVAVAVPVAVGVGVGEAVGGVGSALKVPYTARVNSSMILEPVYPVRSPVIAWST